jgi:hypothetical protein
LVSITLLTYSKAFVVVKELDQRYIISFNFRKDNVEVERQLLKRILEIQQMEDTDKNHILYTIDALIKNVKLNAIS